MKIFTGLISIIIVLSFSCKQDKNNNKSIESFKKDSISKFENASHDNELTCDSIILNDNFNVDCLCESSNNSFEQPMCIIEQYQKADSLLEVLFNKIIGSIDAEIKECKMESRHLKKEDKQLNDNLISYNKRLKKALIISQIKWRESMENDANVIENLYDGGSGRVESVHYEMVRHIRLRIDWLKQSFSID